jgi:hypothetical protein
MSKNDFKDLLKNVIPLDDAQAAPDPPEQDALSFMPTN